VYLSGYNAPEVWVTTVSADSAAVKYFHKDDGEQINCVHTTPAGIFIDKDSSVGMLKGDNNITFYWRDIANDVGCVDDRLVQMVDGELVWLSKNGYYAWDFTNAPRPISRKVTPYTRLIRRANSSESVWTTNTKDAWTQGIYTGWDADILDGGIKTITYEGSTTVHGATAYRSMFPYSWIGETPNAWTPSWAVIKTTVSYGEMRVVNAADDVFISSMVISHGCGFIDTYTLNEITNIPGSGNIKVKIIGFLNPLDIKTSPPFDRSYGARIYAVNRTCISQTYFSYKTDWGISSTSVESPVFDIALSTPPCVVGYQGSSITLNWYASSDNNIYISTTIALPGGAIPSDYRKRYAKYTVAFASNVVLSSFTSLTIYPIISSAAYKSPVHFTSDDISAFKLFTVSDIETGVIPSYYVRAASYTYLSDDAFPSWTLQPKNDTIVAPAGTYVQFKVEPNIATGTQTVVVNSVSIGYLIGAVSPPGASVVDDHRYIASVSHNSATENDIVYVWQKNKEWVFSDRGVASLTNYNNKPIAGAVNSLSRIWYIMDQFTYSFDGTPINSVWVSKNFTLGQVNNHKVLDRVWIAAENSGLANLGIEWQANRDGAWHGSSTTLSATSFINREVEGLFETQYPGRQFAFKFTGNELGKYFRLKMFSLYFTVKPLIKD
jgi:hypothetical protein